MVRVMGLRVIQVRWRRVAGALAVLSVMATGCCSFPSEEYEARLAAVEEQSASPEPEPIDVDERLNEQLDTALRRREIAEGGHARLSDLVKTLEDDLAKLRQEYAVAKKDLREKVLLLNMRERGLNFADLLPGPPVLAIDAQVVAVKLDIEPALALLSAGSDDGVQAGYRFSIYRGSQFIGKVVVEKVLRDSSGCRVLFTAYAKEIQAGDSAATRLQ